jgi:ABC-type antimicrobial peptide transport system permease subunit
LVAIGVAIGVLGSIGLTRFLASVLYETSPSDPVTFAAVILVFTAVAAAACYLPARRAANVEPSEALRAE